MLAQLLCFLAPAALLAVHDDLLSVTIQKTENECRITDRPA